MLGNKGPIVDIIYFSFGNLLILQPQPHDIQYGAKDFAPFVWVDLICTETFLKGISFNMWFLLLHYHDNIS